MSLPNRSRRRNLQQGTSRSGGFCRRLTLGWGLLAATFQLAGATAKETDSESHAKEAAGSADGPSIDQLRADLEKTLSGATLVGNFTVTGKTPEAPSSERYELTAVRHVGKDVWQFQVRIRYGEHDVTVPLHLPIRWAGDTPVITVDNKGIPGLGVFTARVMIYRDHYAGFWTGEDHGGHLFGVVERNGEKGADDGANVDRPATKNP